jgi:metal-responsive CopG/Arc/MetJ family transcriptional regulator
MATNVIKKSVSFSAELLLKLSKIKKLDRNFSQLVNAALEKYLEEEEKAQMVEVYKAYFSDETNVQEEKELTQDFSNAAQKSWPE